MIYIPDIIEQVVDSIRLTGSYTFDSNPTPTTFRAYSKGHELKALEWIKIDGIDYKVISVETDYFIIDISSGGPANNGTYKALAPYYLFGHRLEISNMLLEKSEDDVFKYQKYPLIALRLPISQDLGTDLMQSASLNIAIMDFTDENYHSKDRYDNVIKPILGPIYEKFISAIGDNSYISTFGKPEHTRIDRLYWGIEQSEGNVSYIFNDPLDAIELVNLRLNFIDSNC